ncbi:hypothetical protein C1H46_043380 [Malus baccata]|uniref:Uncharacterized protein n=1 Tax=Malus baccata TaxID=106549 RepID=A0A540KA26_MALBA|nr:hypothetical protein C1H46_043380 [Malus baccata]
MSAILTSKFSFLDERSVGEAYSTPTLIDDDTKPEVSMEEGCTEEHDENNANDIHENFVQYVKSNDWDNAIKFLRQHRQLAGNARIPFVLQRDQFRDGTVLHYAVLNIMSCSVRLIQQLVDLMASEDLEIQDCFGCTAFYHLINCYPERVEVAECMVKKNHNLLTILPTRNKKALVLVAQGRPKGESMARYLYSLTPPERLRVDEAARLIYLGFYYNRLDIAWDLIQRYPNLVMAIDSNGCIPLVALANNRFAFKSGSWLSIWENLIYYG